MIGNAIVSKKIKAISWMVLIYCLSVLALAAVAYGFRWLMSLAGLHT